MLTPASQAQNNHAILTFMQSPSTWKTDQIEVAEGETSS
jgi:hypothetical protein